MQRLIDFLENNLHLIVFALLQILSVYFVFVMNPFQKAKLETTMLELSGSVNEKSMTVKSYFELRSENEKLRQAMVDSLPMINEKKSFRILRDTFKIKNIDHQNSFQITPATVVYNTIHLAENIFVINKGSLDGIKKGMGVISESGVAGLVLSSTKNFSKVMSLLNKDFKLIPQINNEEYYSEISWLNNMPSHLFITGINKLEKIEIGDTVTTGKSSLLFPEGIPIGYISEKKEKHSSQYFTLAITPATDFRKLSTVFVIINKNKVELERLLQ